MRQVQARQFPGGIYFVAMAEIGSVDLLAATLAELLKLPLQVGEDPCRSCWPDCAARHSPCCWCSTTAMTAMSSQPWRRILQGAPALKLLATARDRLNLRLEWVQDVRGLAYPGAGDDYKGRTPVPCSSLPNVRHAWMPHLHCQGATSQMSSAFAGW